MSNASNSVISPNLAIRFTEDIVIPGNRTNDALGYPNFRRRAEGQISTINETLSKVEGRLPKSISCFDKPVLSRRSPSTSSG
ncbi:MAG: hypothetical protein QME83_12505 [Thermodesulfobacteriota bacterium]|nr:hypothetical protein [Thermodesulfobacteriota bacterium]